ncbi:MAG: hypothetical protein IKF99_11895 [Oscillospiraceae bacterium]|nr:hypothetical protein [Oscillospiraceae bacterium]
MFGGIGIPGNPYIGGPFFKHVRQKHMRYCDLKRGQTVVIEQKDGEVKKAAILDMPFEGISVKLEDGREAFFARADFGYTWRSWWRRPANQDRLSDPWR